jgi:hypothetical protein
MILRVSAIVAVLLGAFVHLAHPAQAATPAQTDVLIVFDTIGSMSSALTDAQGQVDTLIGGVTAQLPDVRFGVAEVKDYPDVYGELGDQPWTLDEPLTADTAVVESAVGNLTARGGGDNPEAYGRALWEATNNSNVGWRPNARKLVVLVADNVPHDDDLDQGIPDGDQALSAPWNTGIDPGPDGVVGTTDDVDWQTTLGQMVNAGIQVFTVFYHGDSTYLPYWNVWTQMTGGTVATPDTDLDAAIVTLVSNGANSELPPCAAGQNRSTTTGQCGAAPDAPVLASPAPAASIVGGTVNVAWTAATGAASYDVVLDGTTVQTGLTGKSAQLTGVSVGLHGLRVVATNPFGTTASQVAPFTVVAPVGLDGAAAQSFIHRYGFGFQNLRFADTPTKNAGPYDTWPAWVLTYGSDVMYDVVDLTTGQFLADPDATAAYAADLIDAKKNDEGQCLGFSFSSSLRIAHPSAPMFPVGDYALTDRFTSPDNTAFSPVNILGAIHGRFTIQSYGRDYLNWEAKWQASKLTAVSLRQTIEKYLKASPTTYPVLNYHGIDTFTGQYAGHSVVVIGIRDRGAPDKYDIATLDSNIVDGPGVPIEVRTSYWDSASNPANASFFPTHQAINSTVLEVVPPAIAGAVQPFPNWKPPKSSALSTASSVADKIVVHTTSDVRVAQISTGTQHLFDSTGEVDRSSKGITGASVNATESGAMLIQLPRAAYTLTASTTNGAEVMITRAGRTTSIDLPKSPRPVELSIPTDDTGAIDARVTGTATMTLIQRVDNADFRIAVASASTRLGLGIADNGTVSLSGTPHALQLSTLGPHYPESTVDVHLPDGTSSTRVIWKKLATASIVAIGKGGRAYSLKTRKRHLVRSVKLTASRSTGRKLTVSVRARTSAPANVTVRLTLLQGTRVIRRWRGVLARQRWTIGHIGNGSYSVSAVIGATSTSGHYTIETATANAAVYGAK